MQIPSYRLQRSGKPCSLSDIESSPFNVFPDALFDTQDEFFDQCDGDARTEGFYRAGIASFCVTLVNIVLICISGMLMFRLKEVLPIKKKVFWEDLGVARKVYQNRAVLSSENSQVLLEGNAENV